MKKLLVGVVGVVVVGVCLGLLQSQHENLSATPRAAAASSDQPPNVAAKEVLPQTVARDGRSPVTAYDNLPITYEHPRVSHPCTATINITGSTTETQGVANAFRSPAGDITIEPFAAVWEVEAKPANGHWSAVATLQVFGTGATERRAVAEYLRERYGEKFNVSSPRVSRYDFLFCDEQGVIFTSTQQGTPGGTISIGERLTKDQADRLLQAKKNDMLQIRWSYGIELRSHKSAASNSAWTAKVNDAVKTWNEQHGSGNRLTLQEANDIVSRVNLSIDEWMQGDEQVVMLLRETPFVVTDFVDLLPDPLNWNDLADAQKDRISQHLEKQWGERISLEAISDAKQRERVAEEIGTRTFGGGLIFFGGSNTKTVGKVEATKEATGVSMQKVEGTEYWIPFDIVGCSFSESNAKAAMRHRQTLILDGNSESVTLWGNPIAFWMDAGKIEQALEKIANHSARRQALRAERRELQQSCGEHLAKLEQCAEAVAAARSLPMPIDGEQMKTMVTDLCRFASVAGHVDGFKIWSIHLEKICRLNGNGSDVFPQWIEADDRAAVHQANVTGRDTMVASLVNAAEAVQALCAAIDAQAPVWTAERQGLQRDLQRLEEIEAELDATRL